MSDLKQAINIYGVLDNELTRLHRLVETYLHHEQRQSRDMRYGHSGYPGHEDAGAIYRRILEIQNIMLQAVAGSDAKIQEAVAELALTGKPSLPPDEIPF